MAENLAAHLRLMLVTDDLLLRGRDLVAVCREAVAGGVTAVQLRLKEAPDRELLRLARLLVAGLPVPVIVNDRLDIALLAGAAGVHLGGDDLAPALARTMVPPGFVIGASVGNPAEAARGAAADYWGIGPLRRTTTKHDAGEALGWDGVARVASLGVPRPMVVIGSVRPGDLGQALELGLAGVAVISGILAADNVREAAERMRMS